MTVRALPPTEVGILRQLAAAVAQESVKHWAANRLKTQSQASAQVHLFFIDGKARTYVQWHSPPHEERRPSSRNREQSAGGGDDSERRNGGGRRETPRMIEWLTLHRKADG